MREEVTRVLSRSSQEIVLNFITSEEVTSVCTISSQEIAEKNGEKK
jgi:hypothetical protein